MKEIEYEIINELRQIQKKNREYLKELVIERTKYTADNKFKIEELKFWSQYFNVSIIYFIKEILGISNDDYTKLLKGRITRVSSKEFNTVKEKMILQKHKIYYANRNLNIRNYFNRDKIFKESQRLKINTVDYVLGVLNKNRKSFTRVMRDTKSKKRLYIGTYVSTKLPETYVINNYNDMLKMFSIALNKISRKFGKTLGTQDREDFIQDCMCYIIEKGNKIDKNNQPVVKEGFETKNYERLIYSKSYFYFLNNFKKYHVLNSVYNDNIKYQDNELNNVCNDMDEYIESKFEDELSRSIFKMIYNEGNTEKTKNKISNQFNISNEIIEQVILNFTEGLKV